MESADPWKMDEKLKKNDNMHACSTQAYAYYYYYYYYFKCHPQKPPVEVAPTTLATFSS